MQQLETETFADKNKFISVHVTLACMLKQTFNLNLIIIHTAFIF